MLIDYFEILPNIVYIVDMDTYEIVFMNKAARKAFKIENEDYKCKLCYEFLQGFKSPCLFCTNSILKTSQYCEWEHLSHITNKKYLILDCVVERDNKKYKIQMAIEQSKFNNQKDQNTLNSIYSHETFINQCLLQIYKNCSPTDEISSFLDYIGNPSESSEIYVYERNGDRIYASYSWPDSGQMYINSSLDKKIALQIKNWYEKNPSSRPLLINNTDIDFKIAHEAIEYITNENISRILVVPIFWQEKISAFIRFDNIEQDKISHVTEIMNVLSHFLAFMLMRRNSINVLTELSYHDQLTGALNRHALSQYKKNLHVYHGLGIIYCDAVGLKNINDNQGHDRGDAVIVKIASILSDILSEESVYRVGGDEFMCTVDFLNESDFYQRVRKLKSVFDSENLIVSIGCAYKSGIVRLEEFESISKQADINMYEDKRIYYLKSIAPKSDTANMGSGEKIKITNSVTPLQYFVKNYYFNTEIFMRSVALPNTALYLFCGDMTKNVFYISDNLKNEFDFKENIIHDFVQKIFDKIYSQDRDKSVKTHLDSWEHKKEYYSNKFRMYNCKNELVWIHARGQVKWDKDMPVFFSGTMTTIKQDVLTDPATGLPNMAAAAEELRYLSASGNIMTLGFSVRNFENINQIVGFSSGDKILKEISDAVKEKIGKCFQIFRLDGPHFLAVTDKKYDVHSVVSQIKNAVETVMKNNSVYTMKPSAVAVLFYEGDKPSPQEIIENTLLATKMVKNVPNEDYLEFSQSTKGPNSMDMRMSMDLNNCISRNFEGFRIVIQPQVSAQTGDIIGGEVLLRWKYKGENIPPSKFIPILENSGMIVPVGKWIIHQTVKTVAKILKIKPDFQISFNLSYIQVMDETLFECLKENILEYNIPGRNIVVELTETYFDDMPAYFKKFVDNCIDMGISFALDDFGNGYSSLNLLLKYPISIVKVDKTLLNEITVSEKKRKFVKSIINACHSFDEKVCFEGVETKEQLEFIKNTMCDYIQGFYFYKPLELEDFYPLLRQDGAGDLLFYKS